MIGSHAVAALGELIDAVTRRGPTGPGVVEAAARAEREVRTACDAIGGSLTLAFSRDAVFVQGSLLSAPRQVWDSAVRLAELATRLELIELEASPTVSHGELLGLATTLVAAASDDRQRNAPFATRFSSLKLTRSDARLDDLERNSEAARVLHVYTSVLTTLRSAHRGLENGERLPARTLKRAALRLALSEPSPAWLGLVTLANAHRDDAGRAVQTAIVALAVARELTRDVRLLGHVAFAALLTDSGRPMLAALAGRSPDVDASLEAFVPAATAVVSFGSGHGSAAGWRAATTFETAWLERNALLGTLHSAELAPSVAAELLLLARAYLDGVAPRDGRPALSPASALRRVHEHDDIHTELRAALGRALGDLPPGTVVELATREWAVVIGRSSVTGSPKPLVRVVTDGRGRAHPRPIDLDLGAPRSGAAAPGILGVVPPARARFNVARTFFGSI